jgi:6-phosphogluconolactonase
MNKKLSTFLTSNELHTTAADKIMSLAKESIKNNGVFTVAFPGGSMLMDLYKALSDKKYAAQTDWSAWKVYFSDERVVPLTDERSNYAIAKDYLFPNVPIKNDNVYIPPVHLGNSRAVADEYGRMIRSSLNEEVALPHLDLVLLGLGSDGHTASLFPGKPALDVKARLVTDSTPGVLPPPVDRITFTLPFINAARHVMFLAGGQGKAGAFKAAYEGIPLGLIRQVPAYLVQPDDGDVEWFITDELIAS